MGLPELPASLAPAPAAALGPRLAAGLVHETLLGLSPDGLLSASCPGRALTWMNASAEGGGVVGLLAGAPLRSVIGPWGAGLVLVTVLVGALLVVARTTAREAMTTSILRCLRELRSTQTGSSGRKAPRSKPEVWSSCRH